MQVQGTLYHRAELKKKKKKKPIKQTLLAFQGSTSRKIRGIIPFDAQNHVKCAF
jgi:hypothetical protein